MEPETPQLVTPDLAAPLSALAVEGDIFLLMGVVFLPLAFVALISAWADRRRPWAALVLVVFGLGLMAWAQFSHPGGGYDWANLPQVLVGIVGQFLPR